MTLSAETYRRLWKESVSQNRDIAELVKEYENKSKEKHQSKEPRKNKHEESDLQRECVDWFRTYYSDIAFNLFHPNNEPFFGGGGKTKKQQQISGYLAKTIGVTSGVADLILLVPSNDGVYHGLCIELKSKKGVQRDSQKSWQKCVENQGYRYVIVKDLASFKTIIQEHVGISTLYKNLKT